MRSIARALTTRRRSMSSSSSRSGSSRATSSRVCVIASGVRSSCDALAANLRCSATWASSRASIASKLSASSRNSSLRPSSSMRCESDPFAALRVASVIRPGARACVRRGTIRRAGRTPAGTADQVTTGPNARMRSSRSGTNPADGLDRTGGHVAQEEEPDGREQQETRDHQEPA